VEINSIHLEYELLYFNVTFLMALM